MKERIDSIKQVFEEVRDQISCFELEELQEDILMVKLNKLDELAEELEFLSEDLV